MTVTASSLLNWGWAAVEWEAAAATIEQEGYRLRNDDGNETAATWKAAQDTAADVPVGETFGLRTIVNFTGTPAAGAPKLQVRRQGSSDAWEDVPLT